MLDSQLRGLIVSCQAPADSPLHDAEVIAAMAQASVLRGAVAVRIDSPDHIRAVRDRLPETPIIGLWKQILPDSEVYITPQFHHARAVAEAGADIIALDATLRPRPQGERFADIAQRVREELGKSVMADIDSIDAAFVAANAGVDLIGTTLYGYTPETQHLTPPGFELLGEMRKRLDGFLVCEGGIASPEMAREAIELGADAVVVGTAITGIDILVDRYRTSVDAVQRSDSIH
ncbi:N-acetylmannosamine-6-phosphate 2-epimerase [Baaleninema sp.]|uniref:N-acetylmannosamine-6-phosphate 2-epimerase n=1 Tax=Baaleninema sp. TaxID=3101197 RepID=UPI003D01C542